jgi:hypothetical protein
MSSVFTNLQGVNVNDFTEKKGNLTYLSWANAWAELLKKYPAATFKFHDPTVFPDDSMMVYCTVEVEGIKRRCHLPVLDHKNNPIKSPNAFQVNTAMMRCLAKAIGLHGLGLYIYQGEDLPFESPYQEALRMMTGSSMDFHEWSHGLSEHQAEESFSGAPQGEKTKFKEEWRQKNKEADQVIDDTVAQALDSIERENSWDFKGIVSQLTKYEKSCVWARFTDVQKEKIASLMHMEEKNG